MLTIIANITVEESRLDEVKEAMLELVEGTLKEEGCVRYELHQDNENPACFTFVEAWETYDLWQDHMNGAASATFKEKAGDALTGVEVLEMTQAG